MRVPTSSYYSFSCPSELDKQSPRLRLTTWSQCTRGRERGRTCNICMHAPDCSSVSSLSAMFGWYVALPVSRYEILIGSWASLDTSARLNIMRAIRLTNQTSHHRSSDLWPVIACTRHNSSFRITYHS